ncbi:phosphate acyltransferase PlsX [Hydrogenoanaerobacterium sp.]|uniref:phosphate acyltransferase PlsX n=1 Tax=Hydrogenoanaerobacterium sp. TaxID=2953763 RepID=UPI0028A093F2|nr:phosphate acyltransferase PlsX [Hydrogenoanaerobacterium sp.]
MKVILDAFGGDNAPVEALKGAALAVQEYGIDILLTGDEAVIKRVASEQGIPLSGIEIAHAPNVIPVCAEPTSIMKEYADSSLAVGLKLLSEGRGDAFVTAGSSGALVVGASLIVKRIKGIKRAAFAPVIPCVGGSGKYMLLDSGANIECRPEMLMQFGIMGSAYMNKIMGIENPRIGLINVGVEESKGGELQLGAYKLLKKAPINFAGNVEPRELPFGACDVALCDGFSGNIVLKLTEGVAKAFTQQIKGIFMQNFTTKLSALAVKKGMSNFKKQMDYTEHGGAALLGTAKPTIKAHGSSNAKAFKNAIRQAASFAEKDVIGEIQKGLQEIKNSAQEIKNEAT